MQDVKHDTIAEKCPLVGGALPADAVVGSRGSAGPRRSGSYGRRSSRSGSGQRSRTMSAAADPRTAAAYGPERIRFAVLAAYTVANILNAVIWITFSPIANYVREVYDVSASDVNNASLAYMFGYVAAFWVPGVLMPRIGLGWGMAAAAALNIGAVLCRVASLFAGHSYGLLLAGNIVGAGSQVLLLATPPLLSGEWFPLEERSLATSIGSTSVFAGAALGMLVPTWVVTGPSAGQLMTLNWITLAPCVAVFVALVVLPKRPQRPPSPAAESAGAAAALPPVAVNGDPRASAGAEGGFRGAVAAVLDVLRAVGTNRPFLLLCVVSAASQGTTWELATLLEQLTEPFGISNTTCGWMGFVAQVLGGCACVLSGVLLGRTENFERPLRMSAVFLLAVLAIVPAAVGFGLKSGSVVWWLTFTGASTAACSLVPIIFELGVELTYPLPEAVSGPLLMLTPSLWSLITGSVGGAILGDVPDRTRSAVVMAINVGALVICCAAAFFLQPVYLRRDYEQRKLAELRGEVYDEDPDAGV